MLYNIMDEKEGTYKKYEQLYLMNGNKIPVGTKIPITEFKSFMEHSMKKGYILTRNIPSTDKGRRELINNYLAINQGTETEKQQAKQQGRPFRSMWVGDPAHQGGKGGHTMLTLPKLDTGSKARQNVKSKGSRPKAGRNMPKSKGSRSKAHVQSDSDMTLTSDPVTSKPVTSEPVTSNPVDPKTEQNTGESSIPDKEKKQIKVKLRAYYLDEKQKPLTEDELTFHVKSLLERKPIDITDIGIKSYVKGIELKGGRKRKKRKTYKLRKNNSKKKRKKTYRKKRKPTAKNINTIKKIY
jgi:hypothetical protein